MADKKPKKLKQYEKFEILKETVMRGSPDKVARTLETFGEMEFTAPALGLACRYRGLEMVKALVEGGAKFTYDLEAVMAVFKRAVNKIDLLYPDENYAAALLGSVGRSELYYAEREGKIYKSKLLPMSERLMILDYLCKTADKTGFDRDELLFFAYFSGDREIIDFLKKKGAVIPEGWVKIVLEGGNNDRWLNYCYMTSRISDENFIP